MRTPYRINHGKITFVLYNKPFPCGGHCIYCFSVHGFTKSTTANEDTLLAKQSEWNGGTQIATRFQKYGLTEKNGLKCDLAIKGDSFTAHDHNYQRLFTKEIYDYLNKNTSRDLNEAAYNQRSAPNRCVTYKIETRPDQINYETCLFFSELGITTVELGVQCLDDTVLEFNKRGHDSKAVKEATKLLRRFGFEICYQVMVGLPGSNSRLDAKLLCELLWEEDYSPDALKIYPCLLLREDIANQSRIRQLYRNGIWKPINSGEYINLLNSCLPKVPSYVHINRIQRIIEKEKIEAGPADVIDREQFSPVSNCLWQRSVAQKKLDLHIDFRKYRIINYYQGRKRYCFEAIFETNVILGYARMDVVSPHSAIIRDVRVLGDMVPIGSKNVDTKGCQNIGIGTSIMKAMEIKAVEEYLQYIFVKPSFGTISWFEKLGYKSICYYFMFKQLTENENSIDEIIQEIKAILTQ